MAAECSFCTLWMIATVPEAATVQVRLEALVLEPVTVPGLASAFTFSADPFSPAEYLGAAEQMYSEAYAGKSNWAAFVSVAAASTERCCFCLWTLLALFSGGIEATGRDQHNS